MMPFAPCQESSPPKPLTVEEKRLILQQLMQLRDLNAITLPQYEAEIEKLKLTVEEKQKAMNDMAAADAEKLAAVEKERDTFKSQVDFYKAASTIKPMSGFKRFACKLFTLGIAACR